MEITWQHIPEDHDLGSSHKGISELSYNLPGSEEKDFCVELTRTKLYQGGEKKTHTHTHTHTHTLSLSLFLNVT